MKSYLMTALMGLVVSLGLIILGVHLASAGNNPSNPLIRVNQPQLLTFNQTRPCYIQPGAWTTIACTGTGTAAASASLNPFSSYLFQCPQNSAFRTGTTAAQATPTTSDGVLGAGAMIRVPTDETILFIGCLPQTSQTGCFIQECR